MRVTVSRVEGDKRDFLQNIMSNKRSRQEMLKTRKVKKSDGLKKSNTVPKPIAKKSPQSSASSKNEEQKFSEDA